MARKRADAVGYDLFNALQSQAMATEVAIRHMERNRDDPKFPSIAIETEKARRNLRRLREWAQWVGKRM